jgi:hypothetical protein
MLINNEKQVARIAKNVREMIRLNLILIDAVNRQASTSLIATKKKLSLKSSPSWIIEKASP